jgi:hypothetical protein
MLDGCPSPEVDATTPTASRPPSGNMLGMVSGWSSTFEPEPAGHSPADSPIKQEQQELSEPETKVIKHVTSFDGILTNYAIVGPKKYSSNENEAPVFSSPTDKVTLLVEPHPINHGIDKTSNSVCIVWVVSVTVE